MTIFYYFIVFGLALIVFVGGLFAAFHIGKEYGICQYVNYEEEEYDIPEDD